MSTNDAKSGKPKSSRLDFATIAGLTVAILGIVGGLLLEHGELKDITQPTAAIIVLGGTLGAVLVQYPLKVVLAGVRDAKNAIMEPSTEINSLIEQMVQFATRARKQGIVALEDDANAIEDPFLKKAMFLAIDGTDLQELRRMMEMEMTVKEHAADQKAKVWEAAGGYAPTIGIIGAVMGLIQVMKQLDNMDAVGSGIATAFVATIYGVAFANIIFLPIGNKIRHRGQEQTQRFEVMLEGVVGIVEGLNPKLIRTKLEAFAHDSAGDDRSKSKDNAIDRAA